MSGKLSLSKESLRRLTDNTLTTVNGGLSRVDCGNYSYQYPGCGTGTDQCYTSGCGDTTMLTADGNCHSGGGLTCIC